jgi:putative transposase
MMGEKKIKGRKRHIATDVMGNLLHIRVHSASVHDSMSGQDICYQTFRRYSSLKGFCADAGYRGSTYDLVTEDLKMKMDITSTKPGQFIVQKTRWVVERTFAWFGNFRRLSKDFEVLPSVSENMARIASICLGVKNAF